MLLARKTTAVAALLGGQQAWAQWEDFANYTDVSTVEDNDWQERRNENKCFQLTPIRGPPADDFVSDLRTLQQFFLDGHEMTGLQLCGSFYNFKGVQGFIEKLWYPEVALTPIGGTIQCEKFDIPDGSHIERIRLTYDSEGINYFHAWTEKGVGFQRGTELASDTAYQIVFDKYQPLAGFAGYHTNTGVSSLGFFRYMCAERPEDLIPYDWNRDGVVDLQDDTNGDGVVDDLDRVFEDEGVDTDTNNNPGNDDPLVDGNRENENLLSTDSKEKVTEEEGLSTLAIILIALVSLLVPLMIVLCVVFFIFRKNRLNSVQAAIIRRNSSIKRLDEKMEAKGDINIFADDKKQLVPDDSEKHGTTLSSAKAIIMQAPNDDEVRELLKGKTAAEKKKLLKEIEHARQAKIHMQYLVEQQSIKNDERWAVRNIEERQAIKDLYNPDPQNNVSNRGLAVENESELPKPNQHSNRRSHRAEEPQREPERWGDRREPQQEIVCENEEGQETFMEQKRVGTQERLISQADDRTGDFIAPPPIPQPNANNDEDQEANPHGF